MSPNSEKNSKLKKESIGQRESMGYMDLMRRIKSVLRHPDTERFVTVDGDTVIEEDFTKVMVDFPKSWSRQHIIASSWCGRIDSNGLQYGNGSLKCWTKDFVMNMKTHENHDGKDKNVI